MAEQPDTYVVISIWDTYAGGFGIAFTPSHYCKDILILCFDDVIREVESAVLFTDEMAGQIIGSIKKNRKVDTILILLCRTVMLKNSGSVCSEEAWRR